LPPVPTGLPRGDERSLAAHFAEHGIPDNVLALSLGRAGEPFWTFDESFRLPDEIRARHTAALAKGIRDAAQKAIEAASGRKAVLGEGSEKFSIARRARHWMLSEDPLLAALAASFALIEDAALCDAMGVDIAAISDEAQEIYVNPRVSLTLEQARFVIAHELLHAGLRHSARRQGRDPWLWNVACDYVINDWLIEMQLGEAPDHVGYLHDPQLHGLSSEEIYDRIVGDLRWMRKLRKARTLNGGKPDMLDGKHPPGWWCGGGVELDAFYRRALAEGLELHLGGGRGFLPAGLVEEIRAQMQPPIPWEVKLAHWLDQYFPPLEKRRTFARAHRRQSATPDIPRPAWIMPDEERTSRVFGAVVDTSGSMSRSDLARAIGAIASYAMSRDVSLVRLVQCDAAAHDSGYVPPEVLLDRVQIKGRGGTVLMPGIRLLEQAKDFPQDGPILLITDGACDRLTIRRDHAILLADGGRLTQPVTGPVFRMTQ
jgi:predicted metal-dependent peptidase